MSRAVTAPSNDLHLVVQHGPGEPILTASNTSISGSITITRNAYHTFRLYMLHIFRVITEGSSPGLPFGKLVRIYDALNVVLYFLYADIAQLVVGPKSALSEEQQLGQTALALYRSNVTIPSVYYAIQRPIKEKPGSSTKIFDPKTWNTSGRYFFDMSVAQRVTASSQLFDLTLNAVEDLNEIKRIVESTRPEELPILLSASSTATINHLQHLNIQRTGTPLQLALYGGDEDIAAYLKTIMDPAEFERQSKAVFRNALPSEKQDELDAQNAPALEYFNAMLIVQQEKAKKLCNETFQFRVVIHWNLFTVNDETVANFQQKLTDYIKNNPMHNPAILHQLYEIYEKLPDVYAEYCLFSEKVLGHAHALSSARWLQHYAQGIHYLSDGDGSPEPSRRSFICSDSKSSVDIRSFIPSRFGVDFFMSIFGRGRGNSRISWTIDRCSGPRPSSFKTCVEQKQQTFRTCYAADASMRPQA